MQLGLAMLLRQAAQLGIEIDRVSLEVVKLIKNAGAIVDTADDKAGGGQFGHAVIVGDDGERIVIGIDRAADRVGRNRRAGARPRSRS